MRIAIIAFLFLVITKSNFAQSTKFNRSGIGEIEHFESKQRLSIVLERLAVSENLQLAYENKLLENIYVIKEITGKSLKGKLDFIFFNTGLEYEIVDNKQILIREYKGEDLKYLSLFGQVKDKFSKEKLAFTAISLQGSSLGSYADSSGIFHLNIPASIALNFDTVVIHRIGYKEKKISLDEFINNSDFELEIKTRILPIVTILTPINTSSIIRKSNYYSISNEDFKIETLGSGDLLRKLQLLPSVNINKDNSANLQIRGSETFETLVLIDGLRIYNPTHFYNVFSSVNSNYVANIDFYKNQIPPNFRSMTGGLVDMNSKPIDFNKFSSKFDINLLDISTVLNIPISKTIGIEVAGRTSIFNIVKNSFLGSIVTANQKLKLDKRIKDLSDRQNKDYFKYSDFNTKMVWLINKKQKLKLNIYKSYDKYQNTFEKFFNDINNSNNKYLKFDFNDISYWSNRGIGLTYDVIWNHKLNTKFSISSVKYEKISELNIGIERGNINTIKIKSIKESQVSLITDNDFKIDNTWNIDKNRNLKFGFNFTKYFVGSKILVGDDSIFSNRANAFSSNFYGEYIHNWNNWVVDLSLQSSFYSGLNKNFFNPSISLNYEVNNKWNVFTSVNKQHQYLREFNYETRQAKNIFIWVLSNDKIPILKAINFAFGCNYNSSNTSFEIELYHKRKKGLSTLLNTHPGNHEKELPENKIMYQTFFGDGYVSGFDILWIQKIKNYQSQLAYTLSFNNQRFERIFRNHLYPSPDDSRHQIKWVNSYRIKRFEVGLNFIYSSGTPYFDFSELDRSKNRRKIDFRDYIRNLPDYFRSDLSLTYNAKILSKKSQFTLSIFNLTNRINVTNKQIIVSERENGDNNNLFGSQTNLLSRTFNIGVKLEL